MFKKFKILSAQYAQQQGENLYGQKKYKDAEEYFQQAILGKKRQYGPFSKHTLSSIHWLALSLCEQRQYKVAEEHFRRAVIGRELALGLNHEHTLNSIHLLAHSLYGQQQYRAAEEHFRRALVGREKALGLNHEHTLDSVHWLAVLLYEQQQYRAAEEHFRRALVGREKALSIDHQYTLDSIHLLALSLCKQQRYTAAEEHFRRAVVGREKVLGLNHEHTLNSIHLLALSLCKQQRYTAAEEHFRRAVVGREKALGLNHEHTLDSVHWLARSLYEQQQYKEAKEYFQQALLGKEKTLDQDHDDILKGKDWLTLTQAALEKEKTSDLEHKDTLDSKHSLTPGQSLSRQDWQHTKPSKNVSRGIKDDEIDDRGSDNLSANGLTRSRTLPRVPSNIPTGSSGQELALHLDEFFSTNESERTMYTDSEISTISRLLARQNPQWSKVPRTYIVLRTINCLDLFDGFLASGFTDYWLPFVATNLPAVLCTDQKSDFLNAQSLVLTRSLDLEKGAEGQHCHFSQGEDFPFEKQRILGQGGFGQVDEVLSTISYRKYARKRVPRKNILRGRKPEHLNLFIQEIKTLKRLQHKHVVQFIGSYSDDKYLGLLMSPVAEMDMSVYLRRPDISSRSGEFRTFFGCLAAALDFLHTQQVRHKDIKPENILIDRGNVLLTDFGLSHDFADDQVSTTVSMVNGLSKRYCAPEVALDEPRNKSSDIWSLGVVYLEMLSSLKGISPDDMNEYFLQHGTRLPYVRSNREAFDSFLESVKKVGSRSDNRAIDWISDMLQEDSRKRPHTGLLVATINDTSRNDEYEGKGFCGICCLPRGENDSASDFSD